MPQHLELGVISCHLRGASLQGSPELLWAGFVLRAWKAFTAGLCLLSPRAPTRLLSFGWSPVCRKRVSPWLSAAAVPLAPWVALWGRTQAGSHLQPSEPLLPTPETPARSQLPHNLRVRLPHCWSSSGSQQNGASAYYHTEVLGGPSPQPLWAPSCSGLTLGSVARPLEGPLTLLGVRAQAPPPSPSLLAEGRN